MPIFQPSLPLNLSSTDGAYSALRNVKDSLRQDIINLMLTNPGGHPFRPNVGIGLKRYLFELNTSPVWGNLKQKYQLNGWLEKPATHHHLQRASQSLQQRNHAKKLKSVEF